MDFTVDKTTTFPDGTEYTRPVPTGIFGLSEKGHEFRLKLEEELEAIEHTRRQTEAFEETAKKAKDANCIAWWAIGISALAVLIASVLPFILRASGCAP